MRALGVAVLAATLVPGAAAAREPGSARSDGGPTRSAEFATVAAAVEAGLVDEQVAGVLALKGRVDALVTFDGSRALADAVASVPANRRSQAILRIAKPAFARQKNAALRAAGAGAKLLRDYGTLATSFVRFTSVRALLGALRAPGVTGIRENRTYRMQLAQSLPLINQPAAAAAGYKGSGVGVAILDTGLDYQGHPDASFGDCGGGVGTETCRIAYQTDIAPNDSVLDDAGSGYHGTNVAAVVLGVAPGAKVLSLDVFTGSGESAGASTDDINKAVDWLVANQATYKVRAMNLSLGDDKHNTQTCWDSPMAPGFASARAVGIVPVVASGNYADAGGFTNGISYPACTPGAVSVGAVYDGDIGAVASGFGCGDGPTTAADQITCFSQTAPIQTLLAPGALITAAGITMAGTSQAAPHVAGAVAVVAGARATASPYQIGKLLTDNGVPVLDTRTGLTKRRLDVFASVSAAVTALPSQPMWAEPYLAVGPEGSWSFGSSIAKTSGYLHNVHMTWQASAPLMQVQYVRSGNGGASWKGAAGGAPTRLNYAAQHASYAAIATTGTHVYAAWTKLTSAGPNYVATDARTIQFRSSGDHGAHWGSKVLALSSTSGRVDRPGIAATGSYVYVVWTDSNTGAIRLATSADYGVHWSTKSIGSTSVALADRSGRWGMPAVAAYGSNVAVAWLASWSSTGGYGTLTSRVSTNRGSTWAARTLDSNSRDRASVVASGNRIAFSWVDTGAARLQVWQSGTWQAQRMASSSAFSSTNTYRAGYAPAVALIGTTGVSVAWAGCRNVNCYGISPATGVDVLWRESLNNGSSWTTRQLTIASSQDTSLRYGNDSADIEYGTATKRYIDFQGWTDADPYPWRVYQRTGVG